MKRSAFLYVAAAAFVVVAGVAVWMYYKPHPSVRNATPVFKISATELINAFTNDEANANALYGGKVVQVNGSVKEVLPGDGYVILQLGERGEMASVSCYLHEGRVDQASLQHGKSVTVKGICNGILLDVVLDKCILLTGDD